MKTKSHTEANPRSSTRRANRHGRGFRIVASLLFAVVAAPSPACSTTSEPPAPPDTKLGQLQRMIDRGDQVRIDRKSGGTESFKVARVTSDGISGKDASRQPVTVPLDDIQSAAVRTNEQPQPADREIPPVLVGAGKAAGMVVVGAAALTVFEIATGGIPWLLLMF